MSTSTARRQVSLDTADFVRIYGQFTACRQISLDATFHQDLWALNSQLVGKFPLTQQSSSGYVRNSELVDKFPLTQQASPGSMGNSELVIIIIIIIMIIIITIIIILLIIIIMKKKKNFNRRSPHGHHCSNCQSAANWRNTHTCFLWHVQHASSDDAGSVGRTSELVDKSTYSWMWLCKSDDIYSSLNQ